MWPVNLSIAYQAKGIIPIKRWLYNNNTHSLNVFKAILVIIQVYCLHYQKISGRVYLAPWVGLEPTTSWLMVEDMRIELIFLPVSSQSGVLPLNYQGLKIPSTKFYMNKYKHIKFCWWIYGAGTEIRTQNLLLGRQVL